MDGNDDDDDETSKNCDKNNEKRMIDLELAINWMQGIVILVSFLGVA